MRQQLLSSKFDAEAARDFVRDSRMLQRALRYTRHVVIFTPSSLVLVRMLRPKIERGGPERRALAGLAFCTSNFADVEHASKLDR